MNTIHQEAKALLPQLLRWRRDLHQMPEVGLSLPQTAAYVFQELQQMGYEPYYLTESGIVAVLEGPRPGRTILLRADMDALPMEEESGLAFSSKNPGASHTCGHDTHTAMLLGAARLLMDHKDQLCGRVKLMFQPGEEGAGGCKQMIDAGVLENPAPDAALALHQVVTRHGMSSGTLGYTAGTAMASADVFRIQVRGKACHGAAPELGVNPIHILMQIYQLLQTIEFCEKPRADALSISVGQIHAGTASNIIPSEGWLSGSIRAYQPATRELARRRMQEMVRSTAALLGGEGEVEFLSELPPTCNDLTLGEDLFSYVQELLGPEESTRMDGCMGSEDFAEITCRVPSVYFRLSMGSWEEGYQVNSHNGRVLFDESAMPNGAAVYAWCALRWLEEHAQ